MTGVSHRTTYGKYFLGEAQSLLSGEFGKTMKNRVQLILTSPPFPLNKNKTYGNRTGNAYKEWLVGLAEVFSDLLTDNGSIVIELGNTWVCRADQYSPYSIWSLS